MRKIKQANGRKLIAFSSEHAVILAMGLQKSDLPGLLGLAIRRDNHDGTIIWLEGMLAFPGVTHNPGEPICSNEAPFQKLYWADYTVRQGRTYTYDVIPVYGTPGDLDLNENKALQIEIQTESDQKDIDHDAHFNRAVVSSQAYSRNFGNVDPKEDPRILKWLARGLDDMILKFIAEAKNDPDLSLEIAAYHIDHPAIISAVEGLGSRAQVVLDKEEEPNQAAIYKFGRSGVDVDFRQKVSNISHNKFIILKRRGVPEAVLLGSANFTVSGVSEQNNVCHIIRNRPLADLYSQYWKLLREDNNSKLHEFNRIWRQPDPNLKIEVNFSPHSKNERIDLDRYIDLIKESGRSRLFAMFMGTDPEMIRTLTQPEDPHIVVRGLVNDVTSGSNATEGQVILFHEAHEKEPAVVAARPMPSGIDPFLKERPRQWAGTYYLPLVHHKFIVLGFPGPDAIVITGSANYSKNSTERNDENTLIVSGNPRIVDMYAGELFRIYEHHRARWFLSRQSEKPSEQYLETDNTWVTKYTEKTESAKFLQLLLSIEE